MLINIRLLLFLVYVLGYSVMHLFYLLIIVAQIEFPQVSEVVHPRQSSVISGKTNAQARRLTLFHF